MTAFGYFINHKGEILIQKLEILNVKILTIT